MSLFARLDVSMYRRSQDFSFAFGAMDSWLVCVTTLSRSRKLCERGSRVGSFG